MLRRGDAAPGAAVCGYLDEWSVRDSGLGEVVFISSTGWLEYWLQALRWDFSPHLSNSGNVAGDGLLYLPGLSLATPQYFSRIKWQAIYNTSVKADWIPETPPTSPPPPSLECFGWISKSSFLDTDERTFLLVLAHLTTGVKIIKADCCFILKGLFFLTVVWRC